MIKPLISILVLFWTINIHAAVKPQNWPLQEFQTIKSNTSGWSEKFYAYKNQQVFSVEPESDTMKILPVARLKIKPEKMKHFHMVDVNVLVFWTNQKKKLQMIILDKSDKIVISDLIKFDDTVSDLDLRFGQGRRPAFLFLKKSQNEYKVSIWFDEREQVVFLQNTPIVAFNLFWKELSAYIVTRDGTKPVIKVWKKGIVYNIGLPFMPVFAKFAQRGEALTLFAIDSNATLWKYKINNRYFTAVKIVQNREFAYIDEIFLVRTNEGYSLSMISKPEKNLMILQFQNSSLDQTSGNLEDFTLMDENDVFPGSHRGKFAWLETNIANATYFFSKDTKYNPITDLNWTVDFAQGFPEVSFRWKKYPENKQYKYRYIIDNKPLSPPLPEYKLAKNSLKINLSQEGNYYLHIQAIDEESKWESPVYHFPVFWKYKPETPSIYLLNEVSSYVISGKKIGFVIDNLKPFIYYAEINTIPIYDPLKQIDPASGAVQVNQNLKPGRYYIHIRCKDQRTNQYSQTLHYLFFYETYVTEFTVGTTEYNRDIGRLKMLIQKYRNSQSISEKEAILKELDQLKIQTEKDIKK